MMDRAPLDYAEPDDDSEPKGGPCPIPTGKTMAVAVVAVLAVAGLLLVSATKWARSHEAPSGVAYPISCCSNRDCKPARDGSVRETPAGCQIVSTGEIVPYTDRRVREALDTEMHVCQQAGNFDTGRVLCLFPPLRGF